MHCIEGIKLITFDATNTFLKFKTPPWHFYSIVARDNGYTVASEVLKYRMKESFKVMEHKHPNFGKNDITWVTWWKELVKLTFQGQLPATANIDSIADQLINDFRTTKCWAVADGSQNILNLLKKRMIAIGVISNFDPRLVDILRNISLYDSFDFVLTSYDAGYSNPYRRIFESAMEMCDKSLKPSECLHIGDDVKKDYEAARAAGWHSLLVTNTPGMVFASNNVFRSIEHLYNALEKNEVQL